MKFSARVPRIAVVVPCYKVSQQVLGVLAAMPKMVEAIYCVDDACPEGSGKRIEAESTDPRVKVIYHAQNKGVGGAVMTGYGAAREAGFDICVKVDGDGQMDPSLLPLLVAPILRGEADYTKGNRFFRVEDVRSMPAIRLFGNAALSFLSKLSTGYWPLFDPTNGYTAIHLAVLEVVPLEKVAERYFFETDLLFRLNIARCVVRDVPMSAIYGSEISNLKIGRVVWPFLRGHIRNFFKRIFYSYYLRDFHLASLELLLGAILLSVGAVFGVYHWWQSHETGIPATPGTVMIAALMIIVGTQLTLAAIGFDIANTPTDPVHPTLRHAADVFETPPASAALTPHRAEGSGARSGPQI
jgi:dolichol-phosphate mannosyltransferase